MSSCKLNMEHDFESNEESEYCANGCGEKWSIFTINKLRKELETTKKLLEECRSFIQEHANKIEYGRERYIEFLAKLSKEDK